uniref:DUF148 domain-containing protein n=1 Tax=Caenorhabditis tropicalis TaxID=1561998 RepID=A0A1I7UCL7_9PELO
MYSSESFIVFASLTAVLMAAPGGQQNGMQRDQGNYGGQYGGNQGGLQGQNGYQGGFGGFGGQQGQGNHGGQGGQLPPFLQNVTEQARRQYMAIATNSSATISELDEQFTAWAQTNGVSEQYEQFTANLTSKLEEMKQNVTSVLTNLSSVLNSLENILENEDQTLSAQGEAIQALRRENPTEVDTLFFIAQEVIPKPQGRGGQMGNQGGQQGGFNGRPTNSQFSTTTSSG